MSKRRPNILLITSDQQHWSTLGALNPELQTPCLDRLASQGTLFQRAYCPNPTCTPTRSSMITGKYPSQHGAYSLGTKLPESQHTVGEDFQAAGYRTALVGKAHFQPIGSTEKYSSIESVPLMQDLDYWRKFHGPFYGFQHVELARNHTDEGMVGQHYALWMEEQGLKNWREHFREPGGTHAAQHHRWSLPEKFHYNTWIAERTEALLEQYRGDDEPFFLWSSFFDPHPSYLVPPPWDTMYDPKKLTVPSVVPGEHDRNPPHFQLTQTRKPDFSAWEEPEGNWMHGFHSHLQDRDVLAGNIAVYYGMVSCLDKYVGAIVNALDKKGLSENTLVVYTSDHGHFFGQHGLVAKGAFHYEDVIRVPFIARWPGHVPAGKRSDAIQSLVDLPQSFLGVCGIEAPRTMTGVDQSAVWLGQQPSRREFALVENHHQPTTIHARTYVDQRYKMTMYWNRDYGEIFDLQDDPGEINNLWNAPEARELKADLTRRLLFAEIGKEPVPMPRIWCA
jgi:arylsulfatase A-like enzyme